MLRSQSLKVVVFCPHFQRSVYATRNLAIDRLVACDDSALCRDPASAPAGTEPAGGHDEGREHARPYPRGCPVFPSLAK